MLHKQLAKKICIFWCMYFLQTGVTKAQEGLPAQDTLKMTLQQAQRVFLDSNLQLLAQRYNIQGTKALVEQARKWENPVLSTDQNIYSNNRFFEHGTDAAGNPQGQVFAQVTQLIKTAGKRGKQTDLAKTNVSIAEWQFKTVMRNLKATLIKDFYTISQLQGNAMLFADNLQRLERLQNAMQGALASGNIAKKEYLRVEALIRGLRQDIAENNKDLDDAESELKTILRMTGNTFVLPVAPETEPAVMPSATLARLLDSAMNNNPDYKQETCQYQYNLQNLRLQKAIAAPDVTIGTEFDQASNYTPNYYGLVISLPLPILDRNKGNIRAAGWQVKAEEALLKQAHDKLQNDLWNAYRKLKISVDLAANTNENFYRDYSQLYKNIVESYNNRQISMIEFLEYFNDYREVKKNQLQQIWNLRMAKEELNDVVGIDIAEL